MAKKEDLQIVTNKELKALQKALTSIQEATAEAMGLLLVIQGEPQPKKERKPRAPKTDAQSVPTHAEDQAARARFAAASQNLSGAGQSVTPKPKAPPPPAVSKAPLVVKAQGNGSAMPRMPGQ